MKAQNNPFWIRAALTVTTFGAVLLFSGAAPSLADDDCQRRIAHVDHKLHEAVEHHGWDSPQAAKYRHELAEARAWWWDADEHRWHSDHDWDDHDHDRH